MDFVQFEHTGLTLTARTRSETEQEELDRSAAALFELFQSREQEFGFSPGIRVEYPDVAEPNKSAFLLDPVGYVEDRIVALGRDGEAIGRVVVLTTFGDRLNAGLRAAGYRSTHIDMPGGPDFTWWFEQDRPISSQGGTLYLEAVDEADPKIRPSFSLELRDQEGRLRGGACGSIHLRDGIRFCYLATMTLDQGLPPATGMKLGEALLSFLRAEGVGIVHLGTQTAGPFYEKLGFRVIHTVLPNLRFRHGTDGTVIPTDLVMMERTLQ